MTDGAGADSEKVAKNVDIRRRKGALPFILAMAEGKTAREASDLAGIAESTGYKRLKESAWQAAIAEKRAEVLETAAARLGAGLTEAVDTLVRLLKSESESIQLSAARALLDQAPRYRDATELERRLIALEQAVNRTMAMKGRR